MSTICTTHGLVHMRGCCNDCQPLVTKPTVNIVLVSTTQARKAGPDSSWDGSNGRPFIDEVISEIFTAELSTIEQHIAALRRQHNATDISLIYL